MARLVVRDNHPNPSAARKFICFRDTPAQDLPVPGWLEGLGEVGRQLAGQVVEVALLARCAQFLQSQEVVVMRCFDLLLQRAQPLYEGVFRQLIVACEGCVQPIFGLAYFVGQLPDFGLCGLINCSYWAVCSALTPACQ